MFVEENMRLDECLVLLIVKLTNDKHEKTTTKCW